MRFTSTSGTRFVTGARLRLRYELFAVLAAVAFGERRRQREMSKLHDHFIICGAGRVGSRIISAMESAHVHFIAIESDAPRVAELTERNIHVLVRDATLEETLRDAGVERARGL